MAEQTGSLSPRKLGHGHWSLAQATRVRVPCADRNVISAAHIQFQMNKVDVSHVTGQRDESGAAYGLWWARMLGRSGNHGHSMSCRTRDGHPERERQLTAKAHLDSSSATPARTNVFGVAADGMLQRTEVLQVRLPGALAP